MSFRGAIILVVVCWGGVLKAQEVRYIDISNVRQRSELRFPPAAPSDCVEGKSCISGGSGGGSIGADGASQRDDPHALAIYLLRVTPTDINTIDPFQVEFKVLNSGSAPMELAVSPDLSDLQPGDESADFDYFNLTLLVRGESEPEGPPVNFLGFVELFGSPEHPESMMRLQPGEWIRVKANITFLTSPSEPVSEPVSARLRGSFLLAKNTFRPHPGGEFIESHNLYSNEMPTPLISVRLVPRKNPEP